MSTTNESRLFYVKPSLLDVLKLAGAQNDVFTLKEVYQYLRTYIANKYLYDASNPRKIHCENDLLGNVFGVKTFNITEVPDLLSNNMFLITTVDKGDGSQRNEHITSIPVSPIIERKRAVDIDGLPMPKRQCGELHLGTPSRSPIYIDICESPLYDSSPETVCSVQGYETAVIKDSSDDLWFLETEEEFEVEIETDDEFVEYEVASLSESPNEDFSDTESEVAEVFGAAIFVCQNDADVEFWADSSDNEEFASSDSDPEITDGDNWKCRHCSASNRPLLRFCQKCWQLRNNWLPEHRRPKRQRRRLKRTFSAPNADCPPSDCAVTEHLASLPWSKSSRSLNDLPLTTVQDESSPLPLLNSCASASSDATCVVDGDSAGSVNTCIENEDGSQESVDSSKCIETSSSSVSTLCNICLTRPKNAVIVHGRTGHQMCCYGCGKKLWERNKPCPVCRRTIQKVVQNFVI